MHKMGDGSFQCRLFSPQVIAVPQQTIQGMVMSIGSYWPLVSPDGWCGQHRLSADNRVK